MSTFFHPITLIGTNGRRETVDALIDTGATFTAMPRDLLLQLGLRPERQVRLRLADGRAHLQELGYISVELDGIDGPTYVLFGEPGSPPAIGAITLEAFLLGVDPIMQRLVPVDGWQL
jgi:aspartyl protease family protein